MFVSADCLCPNYFVSPCWRLQLRQLQKLPDAFHAGRSYCAAPSQASLPSASCRATQAQLQEANAALRLLDWVADLSGASQPAVMVDASNYSAGRRLKAVRDFLADEAILTVPLTAIFADVEVLARLPCQE